MLATAALLAEYAMGPPLALSPATGTCQCDHDQPPSTAPDAVKTIDPPGTVLPLAGHTLAMAGPAYFAAINGLLSSARVRHPRGRLLTPVH